MAIKYDIKNKTAIVTGANQGIGKVMVWPANNLATS